MNKKNLKLNSDAFKVLEKLRELKNKKKIYQLNDLNPVSARTEYKKIRKFFQKKISQRKVIIRDLIIEGVKVRHYSCILKNTSNPRPLMIFIHGGGWVVGDLDTHNNICIKLATRAEYDIISIDYSLAPEFPFPKGLEDCIKVLHWVVGEQKKVNICKDKIILCGDSAGGNLALVLSLYNRDFLKANIILQILVYPATIFAADFISKKEFDGLILSKNLLSWFEDNYVPKSVRKKYINCWKLSPGKAKSFRSLPSSFIALAECDPLYDEGFYLSEQLKKNANDLETVIFKGQIHGFLTMDKIIKDADLLIEKIKEKISAILQNI